MELIQFAGILFALFAYSRVLLRFKEKNVSGKELVFWSVIWISIIFVAIIPGFIGWFSNIFGIGRAIDFAVYTSIVLMFYLVFRMYVRLESLEQSITKIVREMAIRKKKK